MTITAFRLHSHAAPLQVAAGMQDPVFTTQTSWELVCPYAFEATWNGGPHAEDVDIRIDGEAETRPAFVRSQHGQGILTFVPGYQLKAGDRSRLHRLWVGGSTERPKDGIAPLESLVECSELPCTVAVHWQFTRPHHTVRFAAGEPFARLMLHRAPHSIVPQKDGLVIEDVTAAHEHERAFQQIADSAAMARVFKRLSANAEKSDEASKASARRAPTVAPVSTLAPGCFDTIDGRLNLNELEPGFFLPERFFGRPREQFLRKHGEVYRRDFFVIDELSLVFLSVPKVACTAIKLALAKVRGIEFGPDDNVEYLIHFHPKWHREQGRLTPAQDGYFRFAFVRNPFDRLVSCYRGKILFKETPKNRVPLYQDYYFSLPINIPFDDFVSRVCKIPDALADSHFKSQYALLYSAGALQVDKLGKFESFDADWRPIAERFGLAPVLGVANPSKNKEGAHADYRLYYTEELVHKVYERYRKDVHVFGYEEEYRQLLAFVRKRAGAKATDLAHDKGSTPS